jgi:predicted nucleic acid-binding protein
MSVVCWTEVLAGTGSTGLARDAAEDLVRGARIAILPVDREVAEAAAPLRLRFGTPDALILATAYLHDGVQRVLTADVDWAKARLDGVQVEVVGAGKGSR